MAAVVAGKVRRQRRAEENALKVLERLKVLFNLFKQENILSEDKNGI